MADSLSHLTTGVVGTPVIKYPEEERRALLLGEGVVGEKAILAAGKGQSAFAGEWTQRPEGPQCSQEEERIPEAGSQEDPLEPQEDGSQSPERLPLGWVTQDQRYVAWSKSLRPRQESGDRR